MILTGAWVALRRTPLWVWGLLSGAAGATMFALKLRAQSNETHKADARADQAESKAMQAGLAADDRILDASVKRAQETAGVLETARTEVQADAETEAARVAGLSDDDVVAWVQADHEKREKKE